MKIVVPGFIRLFAEPILFGLQIPMFGVPFLCMLVVLLWLFGVQAALAPYVLLQIIAVCLEPELFKRSETVTVF